MTEDEVFGTETLWRGFGNYISRNEQYERSLQYYDLAVKATPNDAGTLLDRARARAKCNDYVGSLNDIESALKIDGGDLKALAEKTHTTFLKTDFEEAFIQNQRLLPLRRKPDHFFLGVMKCRSTIEQCLGEIAGKPLRDHYLIIRKLAWKRNTTLDKDLTFVPRNKKEVKKRIYPKRRKRESLLNTPANLQIADSLYSHKEDLLTIPPLNTQVKFAPLQRCTSNIENYMAEKYLDRMYRDKKFIKEMYKDPGLVTPNAQGSKYLKNLAKSTYIKVSQKQEVLRTSRPFYFLKYQEAKISGNLQSRQAAELQIHQQNYKKEADKILYRMEKACNEKKLHVIIEMAEKMITFCEGKPKRLLPDREEYLRKILDYLRKGYYELYRLNPDQVKWDQDKRIMVCLDQPISREPSTDSVISQFEPGIDLNQQLKLFESRLAKAEHADEVCWCYHELARYSMLTKKLDTARIYAKKCMLDIEGDKSLEEWYLSLLMLVVRTSVRMQNTRDAINEVQEALEIAERRQDNILKSYLKRMKFLISEIEFDELGGAKVTDKRQKKILALMTNDKMKEELQSLFRTMAALPSDRRMPIIPNAFKTAMSKDEPAGTSPSSIKLKRSKSQRVSTTDISPKPPEGAGFMELIKYHI